MAAEQPRVVETWVVEALAAALQDVGCPPVIAQQLASKVRVDRPASSTEWLLMLNNHGTACPENRSDAEYAVEHLGRNAAADDAEAVDRTARGECVSNLRVTGSDVPTARMAAGGSGLLPLPVLAPLEVDAIFVVDVDQQIHCGPMVRHDHRIDPGVGRL